MNMHLLLARAIPGSKTTLHGHIQRAERIAAAITERWQFHTPYQWQAKHLRWFLSQQTHGMSCTSRYDYWRTCRALASVLGKWPAWEVHLRGEWNPHSKRHSGGRPAKLANRFSN